MSARKADQEGFLEEESPFRSVSAARVTRQHSHRHRQGKTSIWHRSKGEEAMASALWQAKAHALPDSTPVCFSAMCCLLVEHLHWNDFQGSPRPRMPTQIACACHPQPMAMARQKSPKLHDFCHQARMCCRIFLNTAH